jgi:hypothetical protein
VLCDDWEVRKHLGQLDRKPWEEGGGEPSNEGSPDTDADQGGAPATPAARAGRAAKGEAKA